MRIFTNNVFAIAVVSTISLSYSTFALSASPTIDEIDDQMSNVSEAITVNFVVDDADTDVDLLTLSATSSNQVILRDDRFIFGGSGANRNVRLKPAPGLDGATIVTVTVSDGETESSEIFEYVVGAEPTGIAPTITEIDGQITDVSTPLVVNFTVDDADTDADSLILTASSSNEVLMRNDKITFAGSGNSRTAQLNPAPGLTGITTVSITVSDGQNESSVNFEFEVGTPGGGIAPTISELDDQSVDVNEVITVNFTIDDIDTDVSALVLSGTSSDQVILRDDKIIFGGSGTDRDFRLKPAPGLSGTTTVVITVSDGQNESSQSFEYEVGAPASGIAPTISELDDQSVNVNEVLTVNFTIDDIDTDVNALVLSATSSDQVILRNDKIIFGGSGADRDFRLKPAPGLSGTAIVTITVSDGQNESSQSFEYEVGAPASGIAPTISELDDQSVDVNEVLTVNFTVDDIDTDVNALVLSATSSDQVILRDDKIIFGGSGADRDFRLKPAPGLSGTAIVTITVSDGESESSQSFEYEVGAPASGIAPTISEIDDQAADVTTAIKIEFTVDDEDTDVDALVVTATSSNELLIRNDKVIFSGSGSNRSADLKPAPGVSGTSTIVITVSDGENESSEEFDFVVGGESAAPTISMIEDQTTVINVVKIVDFMVDDVDTDVNTLVISATSSNQQILPDSEIIFGGTGTNRTVRLRPVFGLIATSTVTITVSDGQNETLESFDFEVTLSN
jgi:hypothetical protein